MTYPPDPVSQPSLPPPDPVLQPPAPMPWDRAWEPSPPPAPPAPPPRVRKVPRDPVVITRPAPSTPRPHAATPTPTHARPTPPHTAETPTWRPERKRRKRPGWLTIGIVALLAICAGNVVDSIRKATGDLPYVDPAPTPRERGISGPAVPVVGPDTIVDGGPASFDLPVGTGVRFTDRDGTWTVALMGVDRVEECQDLLGSPVPVLIFDIYYEVLDGGVSVVPFNDFAFVLPDGTAAKPSRTPMCLEAPLVMTDIWKGESLRGGVSIPVPPGTDGTRGELSYGQLGPPTASWTVP